MCRKLDLGCLRAAHADQHADTYEHLDSHPYSNELSHLDEDSDAHEYADSDSHVWRWCSAWADSSSETYLR